MTGRKIDEVSKLKYKIQNRDKVWSQKIKLKVCGDSQIYIYIFFFFFFWLFYFLDSLVGKEYSCNAGDQGSFPRPGRSAGEGMGFALQYSWASLVAQLVKNPPAMQETWIQPLGWEDTLEKVRLPTGVGSRSTSTSGWFLFPAVYCFPPQIYSLLRHMQMMVCMWLFAITNSNVVKNTF